MAVVNVQYQCGCGFITAQAEEAVKHSDNEKHILTVLGTIKPSSTGTLKWNTE